MFKLQIHTILLHTLTHTFLSVVLTTVELKAEGSIKRNISWEVPKYTVTQTTVHVLE